MKEYYLPLGMSVGFCKKDFSQRLKDAAEAGFQYIDFDISGYWSNPKEQAKYYAKMEEGLEDVKRAGLKINAVHLAFGTPWDPSDKWEFRRKKVVKKLVSAIKKTEGGDPFCYVLHASFEPISNKKREKRIQSLLRSLPEICAATKSLICIEVLPRTCLFNTAKESLEILKRAGIENLKICLDTNHFLQEKTEEGVLALGDNVKTLHVSDHDYKNERHWMPGKGSIDWNAVLGALEKTGYSGVFNYEVDNVSASEVKENYKMLFDGYNAAKNNGKE